MARKVSYTKDDILKRSVDFIKENGYFNLTVRDLSKYIGCSTQPIFKNFKNFDEYKTNLKLFLREDYTNFIKKYVNKEDYLYSISYAYALYAKKEPNIFYAMFMADLSGTRTIRQVLDTKRNKETIIAMTTQYNISIDEAERIYKDVRFYTHGIATQLCIKSIELTEQELEILIKNNIKTNLRGN